MATWTSAGGNFLLDETVVFREAPEDHVKPQVAILLVLAATACSRAGSDERAFAWSEELPPGSIVHFRNGAGTIEVRPAQGQNVVVSGSRRWRHGREKDVQFVVTHQGNDYFVCAMWRNSGKCAANGYRGKNTGGLLSMFSLFHRSTDATAGLSADVPANVIVDAGTSNGSVTIDGIAAGVTAHAVNGNVTATNVSGPLSLQTTNGNVRLSADSVAAADPISLSTTNGNVQAQLPRNIEGNFDLSVVNGSVHSDFPLAQMPKSGFGRRLHGQVGSSTRAVKLHSMNGSVSITARPASAHE
jgi:Putative adhesin